MRNVSRISLALVIASLCFGLQAYKVWETVWPENIQWITTHELDDGEVILVQDSSGISVFGGDTPMHSIDFEFREIETVSEDNDIFAFWVDTLDDSTTSTLHWQRVYPVGGAEDSFTIDNTYSHDIVPGFLAEGTMMAGCSNRIYNLETKELWLELEDYGGDEYVIYAIQKDSTGAPFLGLIWYHHDYAAPFGPIYHVHSAFASFNTSLVDTQAITQWASIQVGIRDVSSSVYYDYTREYFMPVNYPFIFTFRPNMYKRNRILPGVGHWDDRYFVPYSGREIECSDFTPEPFVSGKFLDDSEVSIIDSLIYHVDSFAVLDSLSCEYLHNSLFYHIMEMVTIYPGDWVESDIVDYFECHLPSNNIVIDYNGDGLDELVLFMADTLRLYSFVDSVFRICETPRIPQALTISAFPNPFNSTVNISVPDMIAAIRIFDVVGREVECLNVFGGSGTLVWQPDEGLVSGVYLVCGVDQAGRKIGHRRVMYIR